MTNVSDFDTSGDLIDETSIKLAQQYEQCIVDILAHVLQEGYDGVEIITETTRGPLSYDMELRVWNGAPPAHPPWESDVIQYDLRDLPSYMERELLERATIEVDQ
jgi:hypothetical protein